MTEPNTIKRAVRGDEDAQHRLYEAYHGAAFRLAYLLLQDTYDAEEVVQDSFAYVLHNIGRYDAERGSFWAWLRVTLVSRCRNKRRRKELAQLSLDSLEAAGRGVADSRSRTDPVAMLETADMRRAVWEALRAVSPAAREALILRFYADLPYKDIADALGCSPEAARARVANGKVQLRRMLAELAGEVLPGAAIARPGEVG